MRQHLLPVWGDSRFTPSAKTLGLQPGEWWDVPPISYGNALISYVHWKKPFQFPKDSYIFGDSGGFTLRSPTMDVTIDPVGVLRWQESMCTVGCVLDIPPGVVGKRDWDGTLDKTVKHTQRALPYYKAMRERGTKFRWWGVLHGHNEEEVRAYHRALSNVYPFDDEGEGWAIRPEPMVSIYTVARSLRILQSLGIKRAHFLAATSQKVIGVLQALAPQAGIELLTFDSAYPTKTGFNRILFKPYDDNLRFKLYMETGKDWKGRQWLLDECVCPVCARMRTRSTEDEKGQNELLLKDRFPGWWSTWFQLHNFYIQARMVEARQLADTDAVLRSMIPSAVYSQVMRIFEEEGHEVVPTTDYRGRSIMASGSSRGLLDYLK